MVQAEWSGRGNRTVNVHNVYFQSCRESRRTCCREFKGLSRNKRKTGRRTLQDALMLLMLEFHLPNAGCRTLQDALMLLMLEFHLPNAGCRTLQGAL
jgi:hypothetical protein